ncbi:MAG: D-cysteine desulfhydrase family protein [Alphaproteobacteria bacterium]|nr:D-cysteine desulfhydrase family protein [Alphaproteobacteria bacterium]
MPRALALARLPTPVLPAPRLSDALGVEVWVKRDDLTGLGLSGNKVRKLDFLLADAVDRGCDCVLTTGGLQSNHARATAVACRQLGLEPFLLLRGAIPDVADSNLLLDHLLGATLRTCTTEGYRQRDAMLQAWAEELRAEGRTPCVIPEGGSCGLGSLGYVRAAAELAHQEAPAFDGIVCAVGSGGTLAGLARGGLDAPVHGVAVCDDRATFAARVRTISAEIDAIAPGTPPLGEEGRAWSVVEGYQGAGYGLAGPEVWDTLQLAARTEGLLLDPVYTAKALHALRTEARAGRWRGRWLFWHTGGAFGLFGRGAELARP